METLSLPRETAETVHHLKVASRAFVEGRIANWYCDVSDSGFDSEDIRREILALIDRGFIPIQYELGGQGAAFYQSSHFCCLAPSALASETIQTLSQRNDLFFYALRPDDSLMQHGTELQRTPIGIDHEGKVQSALGPEVGTKLSDEVVYAFSPGTLTRELRQILHTEYYYLEMGGKISADPRALWQALGVWAGPC